MKSGTGKALWLTLLAVAAAALPAHAAAAPGTVTSIATAGDQGARAVAPLDIFTLEGAPVANRISAFPDPSSGRLTLVSPEGITAPSSPSGVCTQDSPTQVSCTAGYVDVIAGDLGGGADSFSAAPTLAVAVGANLPGADRPLLGGPGRDRLIGGAADDLILGGSGPDVLRGAGATDILRGEAGADSIGGGASPDALYGGPGPDKLNGGGGRDRCVGGPDTDVGKSCTESRQIP